VASQTRRAAAATTSARLQRWFDLPPLGAAALPTATAAVGTARVHPRPAMEPRPGDDDATAAAAVPAVDETAAAAAAAATAAAAAAGAGDPPLPPRVRGGAVFPVPLPPSPATRPTVYLNVYNLTMPSPPPSLVTFTSMLASTGLGLHHSGVQVGTTEYAFGGHCEGGTGVFEVRPRRAPGAEFRESIELGACVYSAAEVKEIVRALGVAWPGAGYNLLSRYVVGQGLWGGGCCAREVCSVRRREPHPCVRASECVLLLSSCARTTWVRVQLLTPSGLVVWFAFLLLFVCFLLDDGSGVLETATTLRTSCAGD